LRQAVRCSASPSLSEAGPWEAESSRLGRIFGPRKALDGSPRGPSLQSSWLEP
jgi:hypothetical protein